MSTPSISVVIPAHQAERFLAESIDSVLAQDLAPDEVIVVDDGSTDGTAGVIGSFGDRVRALRHDTNRGEAAARNTGLAHAGGETIAMHDADDRMRPERLRRQAEVLVAASTEGRVGCTLGRQQVFTDDGEPIPGWARDSAGTVAAPYGNSLVLAWRSTYTEVGDYDEGFSTGTDSDWLLRVRAAGLEVLLIDEVLTDRRLHGENTSAGRTGPQGQEYARSLRKLLAARRRGT